MNKLDIHKSLGSHGMLRKLAYVSARPLSIIFERSGQSEEAAEDWKKENTPLKRTRTKILGATDQLASFQSWEGAGATDPENRFQTYEEQEGDCK